MHGKSGVLPDEPGWTPAALLAAVTAWAGVAESSASSDGLPAGSKGACQPDADEAGRTLLLASSNPASVSRLLLLTLALKAALHCPMTNAYKGRTRISSLTWAGSSSNR